MNLLSSIPDIIWGALIASISTLSGIIITNWIKTKNVKAQLKHDAAEREKERSIDIKRKVYLEVANAFARVEEFVSNIQNYDFSKSSQIVQFPELNNVLNRLHLVGNVETVKASIKFEEIFGKELLALFMLRIPIIKLEGEIVELDNKISSFNFYRDNINRDLQSIKISLENNEINIENVKELWNKNINELQEILAELKSLWEIKSLKIKEKNDLNFKYIFALLKSTIKISDPMTNLILEMRDELDQGIDRTFYIQERAKSIKKLELFLDDFLSKIKEELATLE